MQPPVAKVREIPLWHAAKSHKESQSYMQGVVTPGVINFINFAPNACLA